MFNFDIWRTIQKRMSVYLTIGKLQRGRLVFIEERANDCFPERERERSMHARVLGFYSLWTERFFPSSSHLGFEKDEIPRRNKSQDKESILS